MHSISSISAMAELVEQGLGVATLPQAVVTRLARRLPLKPLRVDAALPALPIHLSWLIDPTSLAQQALIDSVRQRLGVGRSASKKSIK